MHTDRSRSAFFVACAAAAFVAAVAGPSALAAPARAAQAIPGPCRATTAWLTVTDEQGVTWLRPWVTRAAPARSRAPPPRPPTRDGSRSPTTSACRGCTRLRSTTRPSARHARRPPRPQPRRRISRPPRPPPTRRSRPHRIPVGSLSSTTRVFPGSSRQPLHALPAARPFDPSTPIGSFEPMGVAPGVGRSQPRGARPIQPPRCSGATCEPYERPS